MADRPGTAGKTEQVEDRAQWRVDGSNAFAPGADQDLSDTVVRMPKISADGPAPTLPAPPPVREAARPQGYT